jgi:hypothetical protein
VLFVSPPLLLLEWSNHTVSLLFSYAYLPARVDLDECCIEVNSGRSDALLKHLFDTIEASREFGITLAQLQQSVRIPTLLEDLNFLVEECLVYKVGRNVYRYITFKHVRPWALYKTSLCSRADNSLDGSQDAHQFFTSVDEAQNLQVVWEEPIVRKPWIGLVGLPRSVGLFFTQPIPERMGKSTSEPGNP